MTAIATMHDPHMIANMMDRGVSNSRDNGPNVLPLPLHLIAHVISFLDEPADLGRMCRTCRLFHYMTLPTLYSNVSLRSYDHIRFIGDNGSPEGCGMASPFSMGLSGLATRSVAAYVKDFKVCGEWKEHELQDYARVGRVPDGSMLMNTLVRVAVQRMDNLESFSWELNTKMLPTVWQCLAQKSSLKRLTIKFPTSRDPRPMTVAPPIPSLEYLHIHDIDPLCYPDDISLLLLGSKKLEHLILHWSTRMRDTCEPSIHPAAYFGKCQAAQYKLRLKSISFSNFFASSADFQDPIFDAEVLEEATSLSSTPGLGDSSGARAFVEHAQYHDKRFPCVMPKLRIIRTDKFNHAHSEILARISSLEKIYFVGPQARGKGYTNGLITNGLSNNITPFSQSPSSNSSSPGKSETSCLYNLKDAYLDAITRSHGATLKHLLLLPQWRLTDTDLARLVRLCPNLEQLAMGTELAHLKHLELLLPFLTKLTAIRFLPNPDDCSFLDQMQVWDKEGIHAQSLSEECSKQEFSGMRWVDLGADNLIYELGPLYLAGQDGNGRDVFHRPVVKRPRYAVKDIAIWKFDSYDV